LEEQARRSAGRGILSDKDIVSDYDPRLPLAGQLAKAVCLLGF